MSSNRNQSSGTATQQPDGYSPNVRSDERCPRCGGTLIEESGPPDYTPELSCVNCGELIFDSHLDADKARQETSGTRRRRQPILPNQAAQSSEEKALGLRENRQSRMGYHKKPGGKPRKDSGQWESNP